MTPVTPAYSIAGSKAGAASVPAGLAENRAACQENQSKAKTSIVGNTMTVTVTGGIDSLNEWASSNPSQGTGKWIALDIATGTTDITTVEYQGELLTAADVEEADLWGFANGHFVLWIKAENVKTTPKTFTLGGDGETKTFTIKVVDGI